MSFFDRRKGDERRLNGNHPNCGSAFNNSSERRKRKDRRAGKDRRLDRYHQMELSRRKVICQIIELLERDING
jgi:hypothetical protein